MRTQPYRGSHLPPLMLAVNATGGPILELGAGMYSTCYLHWACFPGKRPLVTYEGQEQWMEFAEQFAGGFHTVQLVTDWAGLEIRGPLSVVLVDHDVPGVMRGDILPKITHAEYVICHDAERMQKYGYDKYQDLFRYRFRYRPMRPWTLVMSNVHDLREFERSLR